ncbi:MAG: methylmalonyl-CoA mutase family protein [Bacteroidales bacterium]|nr:methylmalonyl-CoA mutase family protein [Bacteroidales bacterium]
MCPDTDNQAKERLFTEFPPVNTNEWEEKIKEDLKGADYEKKLVWKTTEGFSVRPYYRAENLDDLKYLKSFPGEFPFARGNKKNNNDWEIRQDIETENIQEANRIALDAVSKGANAIGLRVKGISKVEEMQALLKGIDLNKTTINFTSSKSFTATLDLFIKEIERQNLTPAKIKGSLGFDPLSYLLLQGNFFTTKDNNFVEAVYLINQAKLKLPYFKLITINGNYLHNAGCSIVQELGFSIASANEYIFQLLNKGIEIDDIAPRILFSFAIGSNYFLEIAKLRAARVLWAKVIEQYNPKNKESMQINIHTTTSKLNKTIYDAHVNILRLTTEAMSASIGGSDSISVQPFDNTFKDADEFSSRISRNIQTILKSESHFDKAVDPSAGSYYIENLTDSIANASLKLFQEIEEKGGFIESVSNNFVQDEIEKTCQQRNMDIAMRKQILLGTNQYPNLKEQMLDKITKAKSKEYNFEKNTICKKIKMYRGAEAFEEIRFAVEKSGKHPKVFLLTIGNPAMRKARAAFTTNFFGCAGYEIIDNAGFKTAAEGLEVVKKVEPEIVVICSSDEEYATVGIEIAKGIKINSAKIKIIIAGNPTEIIEQLKEAGVDDFIHMRSNVIEILKKYNNILIK